VKSTAIPEQNRLIAFRKNLSNRIQSNSEVDWPHKGEASLFYFSFYCLPHFFAYPPFIGISYFISILLGGTTKFLST